MAQRPPKKRTKRSPSGRRSSLYGPLSFLVICAALIFAMSVFFRISTVEVTGSSAYSPKEIIDASGIQEGDNLFFINRSQVVSRIYSKLPYVENVEVVPKLPNKVMLEVSEGTAVASVMLDHECWMLDRSCKVLGQVKAAEAAALIRIDGIQPVSPMVGEILTTTEEDAAKVSFLSNILKEIVARNMQGDINVIDIANSASPEFDYLGRFIVSLGRNESVDYKFELLRSTVEQLADGDTGTIDLSVDKRAHFTPD